jgi:DNA modification methylase
MKIEIWPIDKPQPYARNARKISELAIEKVARSIKDFGWRQPIVVDGEGVIIAGHTRLLAAKKMGASEVPVCVAADLSPEQVKAYRLADNRSHEEAEWDLDMLGAELFDLKGLGFDLGSTAFDEDELADLLTPKGLIGDEDAVPEAPANPVTVPGDVYRLGTHRLMCGDAISVADMDYLLEGRTADLIFTDPPYGCDFQSGRSKGGTATRFAKIKNDDQVLNIAGIVEARLAQDSAAFVWTSHSVYPGWRNQFDAIYKQTIIWHKPGGGGDLRGSYAVDYEMALFCVKGHPKFRAIRGMAVWTIGKDQVMQYKHPTQKPVALPEKAILDFSDPGGLVLDMFGGSGSTLMACEKTGRTCRMAEIDPAYCDVIIARWEAATGKKAVLADGGQTFDQLREQRLGVVA